MRVVTFCRPRNWLFLLVELRDLSGNYHSLKEFVSLIHKTFKAGQKRWDTIFDQLRCYTIYKNTVGAVPD